MRGHLWYHDRDCCKNIQLNVPYCCCKQDQEHYWPLLVGQERFADLSVGDKRIRRQTRRENNIPCCCCCFWWFCLGSISKTFVSERTTSHTHATNSSRFVKQTNWLEHREFDKFIDRFVLFFAHHDIRSLAVL